MPELIIWALLAVAVFSKANSNLKSEGDYYLAWGSKAIGIEKQHFPIKDFWGREDDIKALLSSHKPTRIKIEGL
jgi:hypothetical protein